ncbi:MAG: hypothetical protein QGD89_01970 [Actinomycetota bacterium]|nr:hypothetical protein [Actinomycetota bacterium]
MTAHEVFTSLFWLVAGGYAVYLAWFATRAIRERVGRPHNLPRDR